MTKQFSQESYLKVLTDFDDNDRQALVLFAMKMLKKHGAKDIRQGRVIFDVELKDGEYSINILKESDDTNA